MTRCTGQKTHSFSEKKKEETAHFCSFFSFKVGIGVSIPDAEKRKGEPKAPRFIS